MTSGPDIKVVTGHARANWKIKVATIGALACVVFGFAAAYPAIARMWQEPGDRFSLPNYSSLGSYFQGAVASFWSLGGLLLIYATFLAQQQQNARQERELEDQKRQHQAQQESIKRQNFESAFFQLLNFQNQITEHGSVKHSKREFGHLPAEETISGRTRFLTLAVELKTRFGERRPSPERAKDPKFVREQYSEFYQKFQPVLGHYFRTLYHVFRFVAQSDFSKDEKRRYSSLARAQLSSGELLLLFYNCLSEYGEKFRPLVEEFGLLEHLDRNMLLDSSHVGFYAEEAYS